LYRQTTSVALLPLGVKVKLASAPDVIIRNALVKSVMVYSLT
jgi:hypothetical protein